MVTTLLRFGTACSVLLACGDGTVIGPIQPGARRSLEDARLAVVQGAAQEGVVDSLLPQPLVVEVTDASGVLFEGAPVEWVFQQGRGASQTSASSLSDTVRVDTGADGRAAIVWQLGTVAGPQYASVSIVLPVDSSSASSGPSPAPGNDNGRRIGFLARAKPDAVHEISITPDAPTLLTGQSMPLSATAVDKWGNALDSQPGDVVWASSDMAVAIVETQGSVTGVTEGSAMVTATSESEGVSGEESVRVVALLGVPDTVTDLEVVSTTETSATLRWTQVDDGAGAPADYALRFAAGSLTWAGASATEVSASGNEVGAALEHTWMGLTAGTVYEFQLVSYRGTRGIDAVLGALSNVAVASTTTPAPKVVDVDVRPGSATLRPADAVAFSAYALLSDGSEQPALVAWSATGGTVTKDGVYVAGSSAGTYRVVAALVAGGQSDTASVEIAALAPPSARAQPTALPVASGQMPDTSAWRALNVPGMRAGTSYIDPTTGVRVWKGTDSGTPTSNSLAGHDYGDGGAQISREWGGGAHTLLVRCDNCYPSNHLVDFRRGSGLANWRTLPAGAQPCGDQRLTFSNRTDSPQIAYTVNCSGELNRINTATGQIENTGNFPFKSGDAGGWLQTDRSDTWFVKGESGGSVVAWNSVTNQRLSLPVPGLDEPHLEKEGRYVAIIISGGMLFWDLHTNQASPVMPRSVAPFFHVASARGSFLGTNVDVSAPWKLYRLDPTLGAPFPTYVMDNSFGAHFHFAGQWVQEDAELGGDLRRQWVLGSAYNLGPDVFVATGGSPGRMDARLPWQGAVGYVRLDGSDRRLLAHTYQLYDSGDYWELPRATTSPDGKLVVFDSDMLNSGRSDLFIVEVPQQ